MEIKVAKFGGTSLADAVQIAKVKKIIEAFCCREDKTMIMVTHYESELPSVITDRLFLKRNR